MKQEKSRTTGPLSPHPEGTRHRPSPATHVAIIGSGFSGIGTAIQLKRRGITDFVMLERAADLGGVWRDNSYPGCACDVESHLYSFSFAPNPAWTRTYSPQQEIWAYLRTCATRFGLWPHLRFNCEVQDATWDAAAQHWVITTSQGTLTARVLIVATGALSEPAVPDLPGLHTFAGTRFHSAQWDHAHDLSGRHVAVIGTGASAIQFVPEIQPQVAHLTLFQRTPPWVMPRGDAPISDRERRLLSSVPLLRRAARARIYIYNEIFGKAFRAPARMRILERSARNHLQASVPDPVLRARLTPTYTMGCKRVLISDTYLPALTRPNVTVVTAGITAVQPHAVVDHDGVAHEADTLIFGTGFRVTEWPFSQHIHGRDGQTLAAAWGGSPFAYLGTTVAGFPNLFLLLGPNTGLGHTSVVIMAEAQIAHIVAALRYMRRRRIATLEPHPAAQATFLADVDRQMRGTVWTAGGCKSWYLDATGRNSTLWPGSTWSFHRRVAHFHPSDYIREFHQ